MSERELSFECLKSVVLYPDKMKDLNRGRHGGLLKRFEKTVDGKTLVAIAEVKGQECWIATGYYAD